VKVKGDSAVFTSVSSGKSYTAPVKLDNDGSKHDATSVRTATENGAQVLKSIRLGGFHYHARIRLVANGARQMTGPLPCSMGAVRSPRPHVDPCSRS